MTGPSEGVSHGHEKHKRERTTQGNEQGKHFPTAIAWKMREVEFSEFLQQVGHKAYGLQFSRLGWDRSLRSLSCSRKEVRQTTQK